MTRRARVSEAAGSGAGARALAVACVGFPALSVMHARAQPLHATGGCCVAGRGDMRGQAGSGLHTSHALRSPGVSTPSQASSSSRGAPRSDAAAAMSCWLLPPLLLPPPCEPPVATRAGAVGTPLLLGAAPVVAKVRKRWLCAVWRGDALGVAVGAAGGNSGVLRAAPRNSRCELTAGVDRDRPTVGACGAVGAPMGLAALSERLQANCRSGRAGSLIKTGT